MFSFLPSQNKAKQETVNRNISHKLYNKYNGDIWNKIARMFFWSQVAYRIIYTRHSFSLCGELQLF